MFGKGKSTMFILQTVLEFAVAIFIIWGLFNESKLVDFEDRIIERIKKRKAAKRRRNFYRHIPSSECDHKIADAG